MAFFVHVVSIKGSRVDQAKFEENRSLIGPTSPTKFHSLLWLAGY